jgi:hypothetical protein
MRWKKPGWAMTEPANQEQDEKPTMKWLDVTDGDLQGALAAIKHGFDPDAARNLIAYFHEHMREGVDFNQQVLLDYLYHAFGKIIEDGWSADHAFGLKLKRGHYERESTLERDMTATAYIILLMRRGWNYLDATGEAANLLFPDGQGEKAIVAAYGHYKGVFSKLPEDILLELLPQSTPIISRDMIG